MAVHSSGLRMALDVPTRAASVATCSYSETSAAPRILGTPVSWRSCSGRLGFLSGDFFGETQRAEAAQGKRTQSFLGLKITAMAPPKPSGKPKKIVGIVKLALEAGKATPAPPVGPALGAKGVNIMMFCKEYNAKTSDKPGYVIPVEITVYDDKSFTFVLKTPPASVLLCKAAGAARGSANPQKEKVGKITAEQVKAIAIEKLPDLNCTTLESAMRIVAGTAANMGIDIEPPILEKKAKVLL